MVTLSDFGVDSTSRKKNPSGTEQRIAEEGCPGKRAEERASRDEATQGKRRQTRQEAGENLITISQNEN